MRWSYRRDLYGHPRDRDGLARGAVLEEGRRSMFDDEDWDWVGTRPG